MRYFFALLLTCFILVDEALTEPGWETLSPLPVAGDIVSVDFIDADTGFLITDAGELMCTDNGGESWDVINFELISTGPWKVDFIDEDTGWILGGNDIEEPWVQVIYHTENSGEDWNVWHLGSDNAPCGINSIQCGLQGNGWAVGSTSQNGVYPAVYRLTEFGNWATVVLPADVGVVLNDLHFVTSTVGYVTGTRGFIARSSNGGVDWDILDSGTDVDFRTVSFSSFVAGWIGGGNVQSAVILYTTDGGGRWSQIEEIPASNYIIDIKSTGISSAIAVSNGGISPANVVTTTNGRDWNSIHETETEALNTLTSYGTSAWIGGSDGYFIKTENMRDIEMLSSRITDGRIYDIQFTDDLHGWCVGENGALLHTRNAGSDWAPGNLETELDLRCVYFKNPSRGWIAGEWSNEWMSDDGGRTWNLTDIAAGDVSKIVFLAEVGYAIFGDSVAVTHDEGDTWISYRIFNNNAAIASDISVVHSDNAWIASPSEGLWFTQDSGQNWERAETPFNECLNVTFFDSDTGIVSVPYIDSGSDIYWTGDGGDSWQRISSLNINSIGMNFKDMQHGWIWGSTGGLFCTSDSGYHWINKGFRFGKSIRKLSVFSPDRFWICGDGALLARWGEDWMSIVDFKPELPGSFRIGRLFPNPTNGFVNLTVNIPETGYYRINLVDINGRVLANWNERLLNSRATLPLNLSGVSSGSYFLRLSNQTGSYSAPLTVIR